MSTRDTQMNIYLNTIKENIYGKDIRMAIHDGMEKSYNDSYGWADTANRNAYAANSKSDQALEALNEASSDMSEAVSKAAEAKSVADSANSRVDNIIAHNQDTTSNTELIDIRTSYLGVNYTTAGAAVRNQMLTTNNRIDTISRSITQSAVMNARIKNTWEKLWENQSPTSSNSGVTIDLLDSNNHAIGDLVSGFRIYYKLRASDTVQDLHFVDILPSNFATDYNYWAIHTLDVSLDGKTNAKRTINLKPEALSISGCTLDTFYNPFSLTDANELTIIDIEPELLYDNDYIIPMSIWALTQVVDDTVSVTKDAEILDARVGVDGTVYSTLGDAIRAQIAAYVQELSE